MKKAGSGILRHDPTDLQQSQSDEGEPDETEELVDQDLSHTVKLLCVLVLYYITL